TSAVNDGYDPSDVLGSLTTPLFQTSTFTFRTAAEGARRFAGAEAGYMYSMPGDPTGKVLEETKAALDKGERGLAFASGMAAVSAVLVALTKGNDHILCSAGLYGCTFGLISMMKEKYNIDLDFSMMETKDEVRALIRPETACI